MGAKPAPATAADKTKKHEILFRLKYKSHTPEARYIDPGQEQVTFEHLADADYLKLRKKRFIQPAE